MKASFERWWREGIGNEFLRDILQFGDRVASQVVQVIETPPCGRRAIPRAGDLAHAFPGRAVDVNRRAVIDAHDAVLRVVHVAVFPSFSTLPAASLAVAVHVIIAGAER